VAVRRCELPAPDEDERVVVEVSDPGLQTTLSAAWRSASARQELDIARTTEITAAHDT